MISLAYIIPYSSELVSFLNGKIWIHQIFAMSEKVNTGMICAQQGTNCRLSTEIYCHLIKEETQVQDTSGVTQLTCVALLPNLRNCEYSGPHGKR
jgi:hypothetical protein